MRWHFAGAVLDERSLELVVNGDTLDLERKPLEVLMFLLQHAGEVCTKDELLAGVWPGRVLSETVLTKCIGRLREALADADQQIIKTAYGFGYRLVAPVRVETEYLREPSRFDFRPGDHPPGRPLWSLVDRLGSGGHGEAWRGRHDKTGEIRVFKFALDEAALSALKREITLFRIINDTVGAQARVVRLLDWNLEQAPYFIEAEYISSGSLIDWARARGGLPAIPMAERLEVMARLAEALAAVHSVGVLHKDLKPSNVLVRPGGEGGIEVLLADFGSGSVLDVAELERLGITKLGFTKTLATNASSGTPMYLAPEIVAGQPFTVKSDIYALGMILYQAVIGDFSRLMSPGWERDVADELLCQDIAQLAEGNVLVRLGDAEQIARSLRSLDERRAQLRRAREAEADAERARRLLDRAKARRNGIRVAFAAMAAGLIASTVLLLRERAANARSEEAAEHSKAVTEFLSKDAFAPVSSGNEPVKDLPVSELLLRAGQQIDVRFARQPDVAAELHYIIGRSLGEFYQTGAAEAQFTRALELARNLHGKTSLAALRSAAELIEYDYSVGKLAQTMPLYESMLAAGRATLPADQEDIVQLRQEVARGHYRLGKWQLAVDEVNGLLKDLKASASADPLWVGRANLLYGETLIVLARADEAETHLRAAIHDLSDRLGERHPEVGDARDDLGSALTAIGHNDEARAELQRADELATAWEPPRSWRYFRPKLLLAFLNIETKRSEVAKPELKRIIDYQDNDSDDDTELDHTGFVRQAYGEILLREGGHLREATRVLKKAVEVSERASGREHPQTRSIRLSYDEALMLGSPDSEAPRIAQSVAAEDFTGLPPRHPFVIQRARLLGLLALRSGDRTQAREWLQKACDGSEALYGGAHWRIERLQGELAMASR